MSRPFASNFHVASFQNAFQETPDPDHSSTASGQQRSFANSTTKLFSSKFQGFEDAGWPGDDMNEEERAKHKAKYKALLAEREKDRIDEINHIVEKSNQYARGKYLKRVEDEKKDTEFRVENGLSTIREARAKHFESLVKLKLLDQDNKMETESSCPCNPSCQCNPCLCDSCECTTVKEPVADSESCNSSCQCNPCLCDPCECKKTVEEESCEPSCPCDSVEKAQATEDPLSSSTTPGSVSVRGCVSPSLQSQSQ